MWLSAELPYLTEEAPPVGGRIKEKWEDFVVEELPLFAPCGEGEHVYVCLTKCGLTTPQAVTRLARALRIPEERIGYAGLKDRRAVATQVFSLQHIREEDVLDCEIPGITINWAKRHRHKLRAGALKGNRFSIVLRDVARPDAGLIGRVLAAIQRHGFPNYFGSQRFGIHGDGGAVGRALLCGHHQEAVDRILGNPRATDANHVARARSAYEEGRYQEAYDVLGAGFITERKLLRYLARAGPRYRGAVGRIPRLARRLYLSAFQSQLFNQACAERLRAGALAVLWAGDIAMKHVNGACFEVVAPEEEEERLRSFAISPTGPIYGKKMLRASGRQGEREEALLGSEGLRVEDFHKIFPGLNLSGARRAYRICPEDVSWELDADVLHVSFVLPKGSYATCLLRELAKPERLASETE